MIIHIDCPDKKGLIFIVTNILLKLDLNVMRNDEFVDPISHRFFMRTEFEGDCCEEELRKELTTGLPDNSIIQIYPKTSKRLVMFATKEYHCLGDILLRCEFNELPATVLAVVSNHEILQPLVEKFNLPFHFVDHRGIEREEHEANILAILSSYQIDFLVLAKYMRIFSPFFIHHYPRKIINIHHSFLPAFKGAFPYRQAFNKGVKIIGATAHFVNEDLDEGPIIEQDIIRVNHRQTAKEMALAGKDVEKLVLAKALNLVCNNRVFIHGNKTVVF